MVYNKQWDEALKISQVGTILHISKLGTVSRVNFTGTVRRVDRVGTCHTGTVPSRIDDQSIMVGQDLQARYFVQHLEFSGTKHTSRGSTYTGSWRQVDRYRMKTVSVMPTQSGTLHIHTSLYGTGAYAGTYYTARIGAGSFTTVSFEEAVEYMKTRFEFTGSSSSGKGTLKLIVGKQA